MRPEFEDKGFEIIENIYSNREANDILAVLETEDIGEAFGIREVLVNHPRLIEKIFTPKLRKLISSISPNCDKSMKSIYFDKPPNANWIVNWHQDLTINLEERKEVAGFRNWRVKKERVVVQPSREILESIFTIRVHLDDCTVDNGALRVIEGSHKRGVIEMKQWLADKQGKECICEVDKGGVVLMKPLILHSSKRTENQQRRRVIHIEFSTIDLPKGLRWKEFIALSSRI